MKRIKYIVMMFIPVMIFLFSDCDETILRDDCEDFDDVELKIKGKFFIACDPEDVFPASGAAIKIILDNDTLYTGNLDSTGTFETGPIENSGCGLNNVVIEASYKGKSVRENFGILCCDTTLTYLFENISCEPQNPVNCTSIDTTITRTITSSGECLMQNAEYDELKNNVVIISSDSPVRIDLGELRRLSGKIYVENIIPAIAGNSIIIDGNQLEIYFNVVRTEIDTTSPVTVNLQAYCLDDKGNDVSSGTISIILSTVICDPADCYCPFGENDEAVTYYASDKVIMGQYGNFTWNILEMTEGTFGEGCLLKIDSVKRIDGSDPYVIGSYSWVIETKDLPQLKINELYNITAKFEPRKTGKIIEEFEVFTSVYSEANPTIKKNNTECTLRFKLEGEGCEVICPSLQVMATYVKKIDYTTAIEENEYRGEKIDMGGNYYILQKIKGIMSTDCCDDLQEPGVAMFNIDIPKGDYCSDINLKIEKRVIGSNDDTEFFYTNISDISLGDLINTTLLAITFIPPSLTDYFDQNYDDFFQCAFDLIALDNNGLEICRQEIRIESEVEEFAVGSREVVIMEAFSQISAKSKVPSHHVYDIDEYNSKLKNYGLREALTDEYVNSLITPNVPISDHSLYFDVDSPTDTIANFHQKPELYLVNSVLNNFSKISANPVATFYSHDDFVRAYENGSLMNQIFNDPRRGFSEGIFSWSDSRDKSDFQIMGGIEIQPYEVYIVWDPQSTTDDYNINNSTKRHIFCGMALLYISSVKSGEDNTDNATGGMGKAYVSFYVEYPLMWDE